MEEEDFSSSHSDIEEEEDFEVEKPKARKKKVLKKKGDKNDEEAPVVKKPKVGLFVCPGGSERVLRERLAGLFLNFFFTRHIFKKNFRACQELVWNPQSVHEGMDVGSVPPSGYFSKKMKKKIKKKEK
jgi:hypothetical protein